MMRFDVQLRLQDMMRAESVAATAQLEGVVIVDPRLVEELQEQSGQALFGFARRLGLTDEQAADAVQETLLRLWRELHRGRPIDDRAAWAFRTIYRIAMDEHRLRRRLGGLRDRLQREGGHPSSRSEATDRDDSMTVWAQVDRLPTRQRHVLYLRYRADLCFDDIAAVLGITPGAARTLASRALERVRRELADPGAH
ncbi:MAG: sigma-70 family RNA polymerase sigma factor [Geodermatophilaceae bacterium]|nr:sigma-70 family RNA polymerase sigma factor [Geodermatophilaceae bacterium]